MKMFLLAAGVSLLFAVTMSRWVDRRLSKLIEWTLRRYTDLDVQDYAALMHVADDYRISELKVQRGDWIAGKTLRDSGLREEGLVVLGIERPDGQYLGAPKPETGIEPADRLLVYGRAENLQALDQREGDSAGDRAHRAAVRAQAREASVAREC